MPSLFYRNASSVLLVFLLLSSSLPNVHAQTVLATSFETGLPAAWSQGSSYPGNNWTVATNASGAYQGSHYIQSYSPYSVSTGALPRATIFSTMYQMDSGYTYQVRFYQNCGYSTAICKLRINLYNYSGIKVGVPYNDSTLNNTTYQLRTGNFTVPADGQYAIEIDNYSVNPPTGLGLIIMDSLSVIKLPLPACTGAPVAGTLTATDTVRCIGDPVQLHVTNYSTGVSGLTRIWQTSTNGGTTWQTIAGASTASYNYTFAGPAMFRVIYTCTATGISSTSNVINVQQNAPLECYCMPVYQTTNAMAPPLKMMGTLVLQGEQTNAQLVDFNYCIACNSGAQDYYNRTHLYTPPILYTDTLYRIRHDVPGLGWADYKFKIWVDLNNNAAFEPTEALYADTVQQLGQTKYLYIRIPGGTPSGLHRMRVLMSDLMTIDMDTAQPCGTYYCGETRDYEIEVQSPLIPSNNQPTGATALTPGTGCTGAPNGTTIKATVDPGEPLVSCSSIDSLYATTWYKFTAPASGKVRISTANTSGTLDDIKMMVYSVTNPASYSTFTPIGCDDDNGGSTRYGRSLLYLASLQSGQTYYIQVSKKASTLPDGTFCISVDELSDAMISSDGTCAYAGTDSRYGGIAWVSMVDASGKLVANIRTNNGYVSTLESPIYINNGTVRSSGSKRFLNRNYGFYLSAPLTTAADLQVFFRKSEWNALVAAAPAASLASAGMIQIESAGCSGSYIPGNNTVAALQASNQDTVGGAGMIQTSVKKAGAIFITAVNSTGVEGPENDASVTLAPNPAQDMIHLGFNAPGTAASDVEITDITGRIVLRQSFTVHQGRQQLDLSVSALSPGSYTLSLRNNAGTASLHTRFTKQ